MKVLKIQSLPKGWCDKDKVLLHACFQLLVDYVEKEKGLSGHIDWTFDEAHANTAREIRSLYHWWTKSRPNRKDPIDALQKKEIPPDNEMFEPVKGPAGLKAHRLTSDWQKKYPKYYAALKKGSRLEEKWRAEDQANLHRLIDIRLSLWT